MTSPSKVEEVDLGTGRSQSEEGCVGQTRCITKYLETERQLLVTNYLKEFQ